jgi:signal transduction histidine kinase
MNGESDTSGFSKVLTAELEERSAWFVRLRWGAAAALLAFAVGAPAVGMPHSWSRAWIVAVAVAGYNVLFQAAIAAERRRATTSYRRLRYCALAQIHLDLAALLLLIALTGGPTSPFVSFLVFHMVIGTIILSARTMAAVAAGVWAASAVLFLIVEVPGPHPLIAFEMRAVILAVLAFTLGLTVYLTDTVASRVKARGVELFHLSQELGGKTADLERVLAERRAIEERKSRFMLLSAHQLRSPLATVKTSLEVLRQGYVDCTSERGRTLLNGASERVDGVLQIVSDLLELAKLREGAKRAPWVADVNLAQLVVDVADALTPIAEARSITIESSHDTDVVLDRGVPPDLVYAIENVVQNALKYSHPGGTVHIQVRRDAAYGVVEVRDHGIGIPAEFLPELFVEFVRAPNAKRHASEGTGLGLAIVREVVEAHGGRVEVESQVGEGSTFRLVLPIHGGARART